MASSRYNTQREYLPGSLVTSYKEFTEDLESQGLLNEANSELEDYAESKLYISIQYLGWHEDNTVGEVTFRVYPENSQDMANLRFNGVARTSVEEILEDKTVVEQNAREMQIDDNTTGENLEVAMD